MSALTGTAEETQRTVLAGIALTMAAYFLFSLNDAMTKLLVAGVTVWQILFFRSLSILLLVLAIGRKAAVVRAARSGAKKALLLRSVVLLTAWLCYYTGIRDLQLAEATTLYFAAPLLVTLMAVPMLGETVSLARWLAVIVGFVGVVIACDPVGLSFGLPAALVLIAAALWALAFILIRLLSRSETSATQMIYGNGFFLLPTAVALPFVWVPPTAEEWLLIAGVTISSCLGQFTIIEGARRAPASAVAPFEYTGLLWAFALGYLVWGDLPRPGVWVGAGLILSGGLLVVLAERRKRAVRPAQL